MVTIRHMHIDSSKAKEAANNSLPLLPKTLDNGLQNLCQKVASWQVTLLSV